MTPQYIYDRAAARKEDEDRNTIPQPELHGAATPAPLPSEPEPPPNVVPLPNPAEPVQPESKPPQPHTPIEVNGRWVGLFFLPNESPEEFTAFFERLDDYYMPFNEEERVCVAKFAEARWGLNRRKRVVESIEGALYAAHPNPNDWSESDFKRLALADAYRMQGEKIVQHCQRGVERFSKNRDSDSKWQTHYALDERRFDFEKQKFEHLRHRRSEARSKKAAA